MHHVRFEVLEIGKRWQTVDQNPATQAQGACTPPQAFIPRKGRFRFLVGIHAWLPMEACLHNANEEHAEKMAISCSSLALMDKEAAAEVIAKVANAGITIVSTPMVDQFMQVALSLGNPASDCCLIAGIDDSCSPKACHVSACSQATLSRMLLQIQHNFHSTPDLGGE